MVEWRDYLTCEDRQRTRAFESERCVMLKWRRRGLEDRMSRCCVICSSFNQNFFDSIWEVRKCFAMQLPVEFLTKRWWIFREGATTSGTLNNTTQLERVNKKTFQPPMRLFNFKVMTGASWVPSYSYHSGDLLGFLFQAIAFLSLSTLCLRSKLSLCHKLPLWLLICHSIP